MFEGSRVAIVTGAARGIGRAASVALARSGAIVVASDVDVTWALDETVAACGRVTRGAVAWSGDLEDPEVPVALVAFAEQRFGGVHVLVNNASWEEHAAVADATLDSWERTLRVSLTAAMLTARAALPRMSERGEGVIVNVASAHALAAGSSFAAYDTANAGLVALTRSIAVDYGRFGIRCNAVAPGLIMTERVESWWRECTSEQREAMTATIAVGRPGTPEEVGGVIAFLASPDASFVNGACWSVDGGATAMLPEVAALAVADSSTS